jgi:hypothetical protein
MLIREFVQHCTTCEEATPHSRRVVALPRLLSGALLLAAVWCFFQARGMWPVGGGLLLFVALYLALRDRDRFWGIQCVRCRGRRIAQLRETEPQIDKSTTIIDIF